MLCGWGQGAECPERGWRLLLIATPWRGRGGGKGKRGQPLSAQSLTGPTAGVQFLDPAAEGPTGMDLGPASLPLGGCRNGVGVG